MHCRGNFTTILWQKVFGVFETELKLPSYILLPYLMRTADNLAVDGAGALTGPFVRNDTGTIEKHRAAMDRIGWMDLYDEFYRVYKIENGEQEVKA